jgi:acyl transferase domain-containing protein/NADP-dependent 3-hydroxy acid dehydrogenase YdfG/acyl carrier protein
MADSDNQLLTALRASLKETERLRTQNRTLAASAREPIAIVAMSCRLPGGVVSPEGLWDLVDGGVDAVSAWPQDRGWDPALVDLAGERPDTSYTDQGGFLYEAADFDPAFFGISPVEALTMDPQQRLLLEVAWEALERAGIDPASLRGSKTGVFAGMMYHDYPYNSSAGAVTSGRVSYVLGLEGPAVTVDTACSSSLVALHLAAQSLRSGECDLALAGGVAVMATPETFVEFSRQRGLAPDGRCKSFAGAADGTGWGEGAGLLLVERLSDARKNGHQVLALVRGSAVNQDGASNGLTAPNGPSQQRVIRAALAAAGVPASGVDVVEAHGTGTRLGDPIEAQALLATYGQDRPEGQPLWLGSVKSNIGHTQAAAGAAAIIKMVQAMAHGRLPATLHVDQPTPHVDWTAGQVELLTQAQEWPADGPVRRAGISAFGISGTNAHVILEEPPAADELEAEAAAAPADPEIAVPWLVSAKSAAGLRDSAERLVSVLAGDSSDRPVDVGFSLDAGRSLMEHRAVLLGSERDDFLNLLGALARDEQAPGLLRGTAAAGKTALVFPGQGSQRLGMGRDLHAAFPVFAEAFDAVSGILDGLLGRSLKSVIWADGSSSDAELVNQTAFTQAGLFAVETATFRLAQSFGLKPDWLAGHSVGEITAAHVAGILSLDDAAALVAARGLAMQALPAGGAMASVAAREERVLAALAEHGGDQAWIAAVNGPASIVISGTADAVERVTAALAEAGVRTTKLRVSHAFHSPLMEPALDRLRVVASGLQYSEPQFPVVSALTGEPLVDSVAAEPDGWAGYWVRQAREAVRFADVVGFLAGRGVTRYAEAGPAGALTAMITGSLDESPAAAVTLQRHPDGEVPALLSGLAQLQVTGATVNWSSFFTPYAPVRVDLPTYPFQRERFWVRGPATGSDPASMGLAAVGHPLLDAMVERPGTGEVIFTGRLGLDTHPWLADHDVLGAVLLPGTAFVELALRAGRQVGCAVIEELALQAPLILPATGGRALRVILGAAGDFGQRSLTVHSRAQDSSDDAEWADWTLHAVATLVPDAAPAPAGLIEWPPPGATELPVADAYERLFSRGYGYGPAFQGLRAAWRRGDELFAEVALPAEARADAARFSLHPALLDAAMHADLIGDGGPESDQTLLPFVWNDVTLYAAGAGALRVRITRAAAAEASSVLVADEAGLPVASIRSLVPRPVSVAQLTGAAAEQPLYQVEWSPVPGDPEITASWAVMGDDESFAPAFPDLAALAAADGPVPAHVALVCPVGTDGPKGVRAALTFVLDTLGPWLADERFAQAKLVVVTQGGTDGSGLAHSAVWGLIRAAEAENPGRFGLVDGPLGTDFAVLAGAFDRAGEPEVSLRDGVVCVPRLARVSAAADALPADSVPADGVSGGAFGPDTTVLITGGTGSLGALIARHLVTSYGVLRLVLAGRRGLAGPGATELVAELTELGASVQVVAADLGNRDSVAQLLATIPAAERLGVVHAAGVADGGLVGTLTAEGLDRVLSAKADGAWWLHELTADRELSAFVLISSVGGLLLAAGQGGYAAANVFLDGLATHRRATGRLATSMVFGLWDVDAGMSSALDDAARQRVDRLGLPALSVAEGLALFDASLAGPAPVPVPIRLDPAALRARAAELPFLLRGLVRIPVAVAAVSELAGQLAVLTDDQRERVLLALVRSRVAAVLGHASGEAIEPDRAFQDLGFDSLTAVELRNDLNTATGLRLPATLVFDYPSARAVTLYLRDTFAGEDSEVVVPTQRVAAQADDPIAIVGMACRYPGGVTSPEELWQLVAGGTDAVGGFPEDRGWDLGRLYDPKPGTPNRSYTKDGGFFYDAAQFDAGFFGISPNEALAMDPQERLIMETSWEALERAGINATTLKGSSAGVFVGAMYHDYGKLTSGGSLISGRVAYSLGLQGPAVSVDTACSSSLVALHLACQSLRADECSLALAGGVTIMSSPEMFIEFSRQKALSADGRCRSFAASANGTGWAEGAGLVVLERLSDAQRNGHEVLAIIRGSAVNQDGASNGLSAPNGPSQRRVIRAALAAAGISAGEVDAVEGHGTATELGDPIEAQALLATYGQGRPADRPLWLGSLKSNFGHSQAAAGVGGVIKMVMAMRNGVLPQTLHVDEPTPEVDWSAGAVRLLTEARPWPEREVPRRAGVSSFGFSGTNAHVIIEQAVSVPVGDSQPVEPVESAEAGPELPTPWVISARAASAIPAQAQRLADFAGADGAPSLTDLGFSLATTRAALEHRAVAIGADRGALVAALSAAGGSGSALVTGRVTGGATALLFPGQGSQRLGMGRGLHAAFGVFAAAFDKACGVLDGLLDRPLREVIWAGPGTPEAALADQTMYAQAGLFAVETAIFRLLESWGVRPDYLAGHSVGEIAAAHSAGILSLEDAGALVAARGRAMQELPTGGAMIAVEATEQQVLTVMADRTVDGVVAIAAVNGPTAVVISGDVAAVEEVAARLASDGARTSKLRVSHAFHSPLMDPAMATLAEIAGRLLHHEPVIPVISSLTGKPLTESVIGQDWARYWTEQARQGVRFADVITQLNGAGVTRYAEAGPGAALTAMTATCLDATPPAVATALLRADADEPTTIVTGLARLHVTGTPVDWAAFWAPQHPRPVPLPTYAFTRQRYWLTVVETGDVNGLGQEPIDHPLLGATVSLPDSGQVVLTGRLSTAAQPWIADHDLLGRVMLPGTGFVELALQAGDQVGCPVIAELTLQAPLVLPEGGSAAVQVVLGEPDDAGQRTLAVYSRLDGTDVTAEHQGWTKHADGLLAPDDDRAPATAEDGSWPPAGATEVDLDGGYDYLLGLGYAYGPVFQGLRALWKRGDETFAEVALPDEGTAAAFGLHPALLDAALHPLGLGGLGRDDGQTMMPFSWAGVRLHTTGAAALRVRIAPAGPDTVSLTLTDPAGAPVATVEQLTLRPVTAAQLAAHDGQQDALFQLDWTPAPSITPAAEADWTVIGPDRGLRSDYADLDALVAAIDGGEPVPSTVLFSLPAGTARPVPATTRAVLDETLNSVQKWLSETAFAQSRLVLLAREGELGQAAARGLVRAAAAENPGRFGWVELPDEDVDAAALATAIATGATGEPELAVRDGVTLVPRLARVSIADGPTGFGPETTVLITGGTGSLGGLIARHLVSRHGVRRLVLLGRSGPAADGVPSLVAELTTLGATVQVLAADVADRAALKGALDRIPHSEQLAVVHAAGLPDGGLVGSLTADSLDRVLGAKADGAWWLHELTADRDVSAFVLISSVGGLLLAAGQGGYAAANVFLDGLAAHRQAAGKPATSLVFGLWDLDTGMSGFLSEANLSRVNRLGLAAITPAEALALFDAGLVSRQAVVVPTKLQLDSLPAGEPAPALLRGLVRPNRGRSGAGRSRAGAQALRRQLDGLSPLEQEKVLTEMVLTTAAAVLGYSSTEALDPERDFLEAGFDSLTAMELRNGVNAATGLRLPAMAVFDHKNPSELARFALASILEGGEPGAEEPEKLPAQAAVAEQPSAGLGDTLSELFRAAVLSGRAPDGFAVLRAVAGLRPRFETIEPPAPLLVPAKLADGESSPQLICIATPMAGGGVHQHARMMSGLRGIRPVSALPLPGFAREDSLPATSSAVVQVLAEAVRKTAEGKPFVLLGFSSGGLIAYSTARYLLEELGIRPAGVILLDSYQQQDTAMVLGAERLAHSILDMEAATGRFDSARLTAMSHYFDLLSTFPLGEIDCPVLFVQATEPFVAGGIEGVPDDDLRAGPWDPTHTMTTVPGDHFSLIQDDAATTAQAIEAWISALT